MAATPTAGTTSRPTTRAREQRLATETKHSSKTSELYVYIAIVVAILISAAAIKGGDSGGAGQPPGGTDEFTATQAWLYVAIVTAGYLLSRGLAKSGSRDPYWTDTHDRHDH
jgi:hypothetical protein